MNGVNGSMSSVTRHFSGVTFNSTLVAAVVAIALAGIVALSGMASVLTSAFAGGVGDGQPRQAIDKLVAEHGDKIKEYQERFTKRYVFFKPPPPPPPPRPVDNTPTPPPPPKVDTGPTIPSTYQGSSIAWVIGEDVYFNRNPPTPTEKYMRIKVGEERHGHKVINLEKMPRTVRVGHMGGEYDVKVFGEATATSSLFPSTPKPSILVPGFIPAEGTAAEPAVAVETDADGQATPEVEAKVGEVEANANAAIAGEEQPQNPDARRGERRRPRDGGSRGERPPQEQPREATEEGDRPE
jgi:hypothetical protein